VCSRLADCRKLALEARPLPLAARFAQGSTHPFSDRQAVSAGGLLNLAQFVVFQQDLQPLAHCRSVIDSSRWVNPAP
jgi:hypothetical protein